MPTETNRCCQQSFLRTETNDRGNQEAGNFSDLLLDTPSNISMLTRCFEKTFTDLYLRVSQGIVKVRLQF